MKEQPMKTSKPILISPFNNDEKLFSLRVIALFVLHAVGLVGFSIPQLNPLFVSLVPLHLLVSTLILFYEKETLSWMFGLFFLLAFVIGFGAEIFGVKSGLLFGYYKYTDLLGLKFLEVPLVIGLLWAAVSFCFNQISIKLFPHSQVFAMAAAASGMVLFDYFLEPFAIKAHLWEWKQDGIPMYNYISWFMVGFGTSLAYSLTLKKSDNSVAPYYIFFQILFFIGISLLSGHFSVGLFD